MKKMRSLPSAELLRVLFSYDQKTGKLFWKTSRTNSIRVGDEAGSADGKGHRFVRINKIPFGTHRIIWKFIMGADPDGEIDHINGDGADNRFSNLRCVTHRENIMNCKKRTDNTSGVTGVSWNKRLKTWTAYIHQNGKMITLGRFKEKQNAINCRMKGQRDFNFHPNHGRNDKHV